MQKECRSRRKSDGMIFNKIFFFQEKKLHKREQIPTIVLIQRRKQWKAIKKAMVFIREKGFL